MEEEEEEEEEGGGLEEEEMAEDLGVFPDGGLCWGRGSGGGPAGEFRELVADSDPVLGLGDVAPEVR